MAKSQLRKWTSKEDALLMELGATEASTTLGRTYNACTTRRFNIKNGRTTELGKKAYYKSSKNINSRSYNINGTIITSSKLIKSISIDDNGTMNITY